MPEHYRDLFVRYFEGYKYHEIAEDRICQSVR
ncbi:hypothetical protein [Pedobacter changchengzhani]|nr:hypothetical protein [Pedobacter changchengzhani]